MQQIFVGMVSNMFYAQQNNNALQIDTNADDLFVPAALYDPYSGSIRYKATC